MTSPDANLSSGDSVDRKVRQIFAELTQGRANLPSQGMPLIAPIKAALEEEYGSDAAYDIGFHLADWIEDAAFLLALHLHPERFTKEEVEAGVRGFLIHVPNHVAAAAWLAHYPISDVFRVKSTEE